MKRVLAFIFLFLYVLNQAAYSLPALNTMMDNYEFRKKCKYGRKDNQPKLNNTKDFIFDEEKSSSEKKTISFCYSDVQILDENSFYFLSIVKEVYNNTYKPDLISSLKNIHSPPPCII